MHISNSLLDAQVVIATSIIGAAGLGYGLKSLERSLGEATTVKMGIMAAFIFAAQMVNFPIGIFPASGHLLGGVLAAVMLGPWGGAVVIAAVLIVQCLLFGDGGLMALGANFLNMGLVGAVIGFAIYTAIRRLIGGQNGILLGAMFAAWLSVVLSAGAFSIELAFSHRGPGFIRVLSLMTLVHAVIGVGEALITGLVIRFILLSRPDLIDGLESETGGQGKRTEWAPVAASGFAIALAVGIFAAPFASSYSDGLEYVGGPDQLHFASTEDKSRPAIAPLLPDYQFPALERISLKVATAVAGAIGTVVVFGLGLGLAWSMDRLKTGRQALVLAGADAGDARDEP